jgi:hypothetical protein
MENVHTVTGEIWQASCFQVLANGEKQAVAGKLAGCFHLRRAPTVNVTFAHRNKTRYSKFRTSRSSVHSLVCYGKINI